MNVGIDVSKNHLDVAESPDGPVRTVSCTPAALRKLARDLAARHPERVLPVIERDPPFGHQT
jgi:hypothetical protein